MEYLTNVKFNSLIKSLKVTAYTDMIAVQDEAGNVIEFDTTGHERHVIKDSIIIDGYEYKLTEKQKDILYGMAYDAQEQYGLKSA